MRIQIFSEYTKIAKAGRAKALTCPMHEEDFFPLYPTLVDNDTILLECYACSYRNLVGQQLYDNIKEVVERESFTS